MNTMFLAFLIFGFFRNGLVHIKVLLESEGHDFQDKMSLWVVLKVYITSRVNVLELEQQGHDDNN